jgi:esterase/lipase
VKHLNIKTTKTDNDNYRLAYIFDQRDSDDYLLFLHGLFSDMQGSKASFLREYAKKHGKNFIAFDMRGHGSSDGDFSSFGVSHWVQDTCEVISQLIPPHGKITIIGSSMGAWVALRVALKIEMANIITLAAAVDLTEEVLLSRLDQGQQQRLEQQGYVDLPDCYNEGNYYRLSKLLFVDGRQNLLLGSGKLNFMKTNVCIIHGSEDADVPHLQSQKLAAETNAKQLEYHLLTGKDHRLSDQQSLDFIASILTKLLELPKL